MESRPFCHLFYKIFGPFWLSLGGVDRSRLATAGHCTVVWMDVLYKDRPDERDEIFFTKKKKEIGIEKV